MTVILDQPLHRDSKRVPKDRIKEEYSDSGGYRATRTIRFPAYEFDLVWMWRSKAEKEAVEAFWRTTLDNKFDYTWPLSGEVYKARFLNAPQSSLHAYNYWRITVKLIARKAA